MTQREIQREIYLACDRLAANERARDQFLEHQLKRVQRELRELYPLSGWPPSGPVDDEYISSIETAAILKISRTSLYNMMNSGRLPYRKLGGRLRFSKSSVWAMINERYAAGAEKHLKQKRIETQGD